MNRRDSLKTIAAVIGNGFGSVALSRTDVGVDKYGGQLARKFKATGFFRTEKDKRWWLVTPEGNAFLSFGINHLYPDLFRQAYNSEAWQKRLGIENIRENHEFFPALRSWFLQTCKNYGFNTVSVHNALQVINKPQPAMPYLQPIKFIDVPHWKPIVIPANFVDVFAPDFATHCDQLARKHAAPLKDDPYLIGYSMTDCPLFTEEDCRERTDVIGGGRRKARIGWPRRLRNFGADAPGKQAYVATMRRIYRDSVKDFNVTYGTDFASFDALAAASNWRPETQLSNANETRDNVEFLKVVVDQYYKTAKAAIRRYDPNHMFIGDKLNANTDSIDVVLPVAAQYVDVVLYQMYARYEVQQPPFGPIADNLQQRAEWTEEFFRKAFARPDFVGWHYCGLIDANNRTPRKKERQHSGLLDDFGKPYLELQSTLKNCSRELYAISKGG
jgi:hypothetical protein